MNYSNYIYERLGNSVHAGKGRIALLVKTVGQQNLASVTTYQQSALFSSYMLQIFYFDTDNG